MDCLKLLVRRSWRPHCGNSKSGAQNLSDVLIVLDQPFIRGQLQVNGMYMYKCIYQIKTTTTTTCTWKRI